MSNSDPFQNWFTFPITRATIVSDETSETTRETRVLHYKVPACGIRLRWSGKGCCEFFRLDPVFCC